MVYAAMSSPIKNSPDVWLDAFPHPKPDGHKYTRGHALIYGGDVMTGATRLAARAAQRMGAGLVTLACAKKSALVYQQSLESIIVRVVDDVIGWRELIDDLKRNAILIGPGLGTGTDQKELVGEALKSHKPCVLDADGLNNFSIEELKPSLHKDCVLTPHEGEFAKLFGTKIDPKLDKPIRAQQAAAMTGCIVLLKGADTYIAAPDGRIILNNNAPPWLATAGAGDVLAGMILGLITQHMPIFMATAAATWLHGKIANDFGPGLIAEDLVDGIPKALKELLND